jgi:hypothetical protein
MSGPSDKLRDLRTGYRLVAVIYHLEGGVNAQKLFFEERRKAAPWGLRLNGDPTFPRPFAPFAQLVQPHLMQMTEHERANWTSLRRQTQSLEYQRDDSEAKEPLHTDKVTETGRFQMELFVIDDSDTEEQPSKHSDQDSLDKLILRTVEPTLPKQSNRHRSTSASSNSVTPCPINCYGCGEISKGDDGLEQVQCSSCGFWSHFRCQPENGEVDWNDPDITFTCQGCRERPTAELCVRPPSFLRLINTICKVPSKGDCHATGPSSSRQMAKRECAMVSCSVHEAPSAYPKQRVRISLLGVYPLASEKRRSHGAVKVPQPESGFVRGDVEG